MPAEENILDLAPPAATPAVAPAPAGTVTLARVRDAYRRWAPVYDELFDLCFRDGRRRAIAAVAGQPGARILEVGVGTGLALPHWPRHCRVTGIDISEPMLERAGRVCRRHQLDHVDLRVVDAQATDYPDSHFDGIAAMYVASVVPDVAALLAEMRRICKPGGRIAIVNHFAHPNPVVGRFERLFSNYAALMGFNPAMSVQTITEAPGLRITRVQRVNWGGYWTLVEAENVK